MKTPPLLPHLMSNLDNREKRMLLALQGRKGAWTLDEVLTACNWDDQAYAATAGHGLSNHGLVDIKETTRATLRHGPEGENAVAEGLLEARLWNWIKNSPEPSMAALSSTFERSESGPGIGLLKGLGVSIQQGVLVATDSNSVSAAIEERTAFIASLEGSEEMVAHFSNRRGLIEEVLTTTRTWQISKTGMAVSAQELTEKQVVSQITPELLQSDEWKDMEFKPFDVTLEAAMPRSGRSHPMQALIERIRAIFLEMGFSEIADDYVQSAGWNMDALFIPQDHPAREMQDTFYLEEPTGIDVPDELIKQWQAIHEHGGDTESIGWGGKFDPEVSKKALLRTHTTVNTVQYLKENPDKPCRVFTIDRVFRKESIDRTHLPEFHQIEGIIMEEGANLAMLVTTLKTFYAKMGYPEVRVRPAYFPYTEPSLEVEVKWRGKWLELGGAGIFRPEVTEPLGIKWPVCAWGMGLERLAMLVLGLDDIRQLYISDLAWLAEQPIL
jgi:phenylalanyl-tRNA synthetase alpha chain